MPIPDILMPVESKAIAEHVYLQLRQAIHVGQLKPGQRLVDAELAEAVQVSRATVRESLRLLESKGLVVNRHRRGTFVAELTPEDLRDVYKFRSVLETHAVRLGAHNASTEELDALQSVIDEFHVAAAQQDVEAIVDFELRFHQGICLFAHSKRLLETWLGMETAVRAFLLLKYTLFDDSPLIAGSHQPILDALRRGDGEGAAGYLHTHIIETAERVVESLEAELQKERRAPGVERIVGTASTRD
jgi:DNA-binding GntR family transcriptional regulator